MFQTHHHPLCGRGIEHPAEKDDQGSDHLDENDHDGGSDHLGDDDDDDDTDDVDNKGYDGDNGYDEEIPGQAWLEYSEAGRQKSPKNLLRLDQNHHFDRDQ